MKLFQFLRVECTKTLQLCLHGAAVATGIEPVIDKLGLIAGRRADTQCVI